MKEKIEQLKEVQQACAAVCIIKGIDKIPMTDILVSHILCVMMDIELEEAAEIQAAACRTISVLEFLTKLGGGEV